MTVPSTTRRAGPFTGTGALVAYPFTFKVFAKQDLAVTIADANGLETDLVLDSTFTVTLNVDQEATPGGTVNYAVGGVATALPTGYTLVVTGDGLEFEQTADLPQGGNFSPVVIENALDRGVMLLQRLWDGVRRSMRLPDTASDSVSTVLPVPTANNFIGWDSNGTALRNVDPNTLATVVAFAAWQSQAFSGDGVTTQFTLSSDPGNVNNLDVVVGAAPQRNNVDFTLSGTTLTFDAAPANGLSIFCRWGQALPEGTSALQTRLVSDASGSDGAGLPSLAHTLAPREGSIGAALLQRVQVFNYLTDAQKAEARSGINTLDMITQMQTAFATGKGLDLGDNRFNYLASGLTVPITVREFTGSPLLKLAANGGTLIQWLADTSRQGYRRMAGLKLDGNSKTGATIGVRWGSVTNNPSAGAQEAVLYASMDDMLVRGFDTGVRHDATMEHTSKNLAVVANTVGMKVYGDPVNGGGNANTWVGFRANSNQVGLMFVNKAAYPIQHNGFYGGTFQENTLCGAYFNGYAANGTISAIVVDNCHFEANAAGAPASAVIDGYTVLKSQMHLDTYASVVLSNSSINTSVSPAIVLRNNSVLNAHNITGYGNQSGVVFDIDSTSKVFESGACVGTGIKYIESYGYIDPNAGLSLMTAVGAPLLEVGAYPNTSPLKSNVVPELNNVVGATAGAATDATYGEVSTVAFLASAGSTGANRNYWAGAGGSAGDYAIMSFLVKPSATGSFTFRFTDDSNTQVVSVTLTAGVWRRVVHVCKLVTGTPLQVYIYPNDTVGATLSFKGFANLNSTDIGQINAIYTYGQVGNGGSGIRTIASAGTLTLTPEGPDTFLISGTTGVNSIVPTGWAGRKVTLVMQGALTITDGSNLKMAGNFVTTADDSITYACDGTNFYETGRSVN